MRNPMPAFIAMRYAAARRGSPLVSFLSRVSMAGLVVGVALLITVLSVMNGFDREMRTRILGLVPHGLVQPFHLLTVSEQAEMLDKIQAHPEVEAVAPMAQLSAMLVNGKAVAPGLIYGIDPEQEKAISGLHRFIDFEQLQENEFSAAIGKGMAAKLNVLEGDTLSMALPGDNGNMSFRHLTVSQLFETGTELDQRLLVMTLPALEKGLGADMPLTGWRIRLQDVFAAPRVGWELEYSLPLPARVRDWTRDLGNMYEAIQLSRRIVIIMLLSVIAVAAFNVVATLVMVVNDKQGDIAILRSNGARPGQIMQIFLYYGALIALFGTLLGAVCGVLLSLSVGDVVLWLEGLLGTSFLQSDVYPVSYLPVDLRWGNIATVCVAAYLISLAATVYPAWRGSRLQPADVLRQH